jgi:hypothetical protein
MACLGAGVAHGSEIETSTPSMMAANATSQALAGYDARLASTTSVRATFKAPRLTCGPQISGIDPVTYLTSSSAYAASGLISACQSGAPIYLSDVGVGNTQQVVQQSVTPGDTIVSMVTFAGGHAQATLQDTTKNWKATFGASLAKPTDAIVGVADPLHNGMPVPLAKFAPVKFSTVTVGGKPLASRAPIAITMTGSGGIVRAVPSSITGGNAFTVTFKHA